MRSRWGTVTLVSDQLGGIDIQLNFFYRARTIFVEQHTDTWIFRIFYRAQTILRIFYRARTMLRIFYRARAILRIFYRARTILKNFYRARTISRIFYLGTEERTKRFHGDDEGGVHWDPSNPNLFCRCNKKIYKKCDIPVTRYNKNQEYFCFVL